MEVSFKDVSFSYNVGLINEKKALDKINITLERGLIHGIIGPIGSGKSTLLELMNGITMPSSGKIKIGQYDLTSRRYNFNKFRYDVGLVYQFPEKQFFSLTVAQEVSFADKVFSPKNKKIKEKVKKVLKMVGLDETYLNRNPFSLNGGEKRLVAIASVLISNPKVLIMDEPTIGLDLKSKKRLIKIIKKLNTKYSKTIIIVTHDVDMLYEIASNIVVLYNGKVIKQGNKLEVFTDDKLFKMGNIPIPSIIKFEKILYDKKGIDLGYMPDINSLVRAIASNLKDGDYHE